MRKGDLVREEGNFGCLLCGTKRRRTISRNMSFLYPMIVLALPILQTLSSVHSENVMICSPMKRMII